MREAYVCRKKKWSGDVFWQKDERRIQKKGEIGLERESSFLRGFEVRLSDCAIQLEFFIPVSPQ